MPILRPALLDERLRHYQRSTSLGIQSRNLRRQGQRIGLIYNLLRVTVAPSAGAGRLLSATEASGSLRYNRDRRTSPHLRASVHHKVCIGILRPVRSFSPPSTNLLDYRRVNISPPIASRWKRDVEL